MKVKYNIKESKNNEEYSTDLIFQDLTPKQLEYICNILSKVTEHNELFSEQDCAEFRGQNLIDQVSDYLKKSK
jgi:signal recognition particle GTPase